MAMEWGKLYLEIESPITVTLHVESAGEFIPQTVEYAQKNAEPEDEVVAGDPAYLTSASTVFHLWSDNLDGTIPKIGDRIEYPEGVFYHVEQVGTHMHGTRFRCECKKESIP
jgi:hypothetical protein